MTETHFFTAVNLAIPDGNIAGAQDVRTNTSVIRRITEIRIHLKIAAATNSFAFNGDLYAYVRHSDGQSEHISVLLNRPGRAATNANGYADSGLDVTFADSGAHDIHTYRTVTNLPPDAPLTGTWQPDARFTDPAVVTETSPRLTFLSNLKGMSADGEWTLFVADFDGGARHVLESWTLEITGAVTPEILWTNPLPITYGTALSSTQLNATANAPGVFAYEPPGGIRLPAGSNQPLSVIFLPADTNAYVAATNVVLMDVLPKDLLVTAANTNRLYGEANPPLTGELQGLQFGDDITATFSATAGLESPVGDYLINSQLADPSQRLGNYTLSTQTGILSIQPAPLTVMVENTTRPYRQANPPLTGQVLGARNGDLITASFITPAVQTSPLGSYPIDPLLNDPGNKLRNYFVITNPGTLTVAPARLSVTGITAAAKVYDASLAATLDVNSASLVGVLEGENVTLVTSNATGTFADKQAGYGKLVHIAGLTLAGADAGNYQLTPPLVPANITRAPLSSTGVTAEDKVYDGNTAATLRLDGANLPGVFAGDSVNLTSSPVESIVYDNSVYDLLLRFDLAGLEVGDEIVLDGDADQLRRFSFEFWGEGPGGGSFEGNVSVRTRFYRNDGPVTSSGYPAPGTVFFDSGWFPINATPRSVMIYEGEDFQSLAIVPLTSPLPESFTWSVQFSGLGANDAAGVDLYSPPTVGKSYPDYWENDYWLNTATGWVLKTNPVAPINFAARFEAITLSKATFADPLVGSGKPVVIAGLSLEGADAGNYQLTQPAAQASITPRPLTVTAENQSRPYGAANPILTGQLTGVQNTDNITAQHYTAADITSPVGGYSINPLLNDPANKLPNYTVTIIPGTLTITQAATQVTLASAPNPALPGATVSFGMSVAAIAPSTATPLGTVQLRLDGSDQGDPVLLVAGTNSILLNGLQPGWHNVSAVYAGNSNFLGGTTVLQPAQFMDSAPVATGDLIYRASTYGTRVAATNLLANDSDPDNEPVSLAAVAAASAAGGSIRLQDGWIYYAPPAGFTSEDSFTYTIVDPLGASSTGQVSVAVLPGNEFPPALFLLDLGGGTFRLHFTGVPWKAYGVEYVPSVTNHNWQFLGFTVSDATGLAIFDDSPPAGAPSRFYRVFYSRENDSNSSLVDVQSSANPALPGTPVTFTATLVANDPGNGIPSGFVQFKVDGTAHGPLVALVNAQAGLTTAYLPHGSHIVSADYQGDSAFVPAIGTLREPQLIDSPPVAAGDIIFRSPMGGTKVHVSDLLLNDSDADLDNLFFESVVPRTAEGGTLTMAEGWIFYTPPAGFTGADSFNYTMRDALGVSTTGRAEIMATVGKEPGANLLVLDLGAGAYQLNFSGIPWRQYTIQYAEDLESPNWQPLGTNTADSHGLFTWTDQLPPGVSSRYYRSLDEFPQPNASLFRQAAWTNFIAHTNGRTMELWSERTHPPGWPALPPVLAWNTNCLIYGMEGFTGISQYNEFQDGPGQAPVTLLTRRHGYARGHGMPASDNGAIHTNRFAGKKVWFCSPDNTVVTMTIAADVIRQGQVAGSYYDYTILIFTEDVPTSITPVSAISPADFATYYYNSPEIPFLTLGTEQFGHVGTTVPPFIFNLFKGGDSGSPNFIPAPDHKLIFFSGRATSGPSAQMQSDVDALTLYLGLNPASYAMRWYDLTPWQP